MVTKWQCNIMEIKWDLNAEVPVAITLGKSFDLF
jgi:hypothetical protein